MKIKRSALAYETSADECNCNNNQIALQTSSTQTQIIVQESCIQTEDQPLRALQPIANHTSTTSSNTETLRNVTSSTMTDPALTIDWILSHTDVRLTVDWILSHDEGMHPCLTQMRRHPHTKNYTKTTLT